MQLILENPTPFGRSLASLYEIVARCPVGERLPSERDLAVKLKVSRPTVRKALEWLARQEILEIRHGAGAFVLKLVPMDGSNARQTKLIGFSAPTRWRCPRLPKPSLVLIGRSPKTATAWF